MNRGALAIDPLSTPRQTVGRRDSAEWWGGEFRVKQVVTSGGLLGQPCRFDSEHAAGGAIVRAPFSCADNVSVRIDPDRNWMGALI